MINASRASDLLRPVKFRTYERMQISAGARVLDVGSGAGADTIPLAGWVAGGGLVAGVDLDRRMLGRAAAAARAANLEKQVFHICAQAEALPFATDSFDSSRSERLFQHLLRPARVLAEMIRVTRPGGHVVVLDTDHGTWSVDTAEADIERRLTRFKSDNFGHNGYAGRQLRRLFHEAGLGEITCEMISGYFTDYGLVRRLFLLDEVEAAALSAQVINPDELRRWRASLEIAAAKGTFFCSESMVLAAGQKRRSGGKNSL